jgi:hypothetical protein
MFCQLQKNLSTFFCNFDNKPGEYFLMDFSGNFLSRGEVNVLPLHSVSESIDNIIPVAENE